MIERHKAIEYVKITPFNIFGRACKSTGWKRSDETDWRDYKYGNGHTKEYKYEIDGIYFTPTEYDNLERGFNSKYPLPFVGSFKEWGKQYDN